MAQIHLTRGRVALVDDDVAADLGRFRWHADPGKQSRENWRAARSVMGEDGRFHTVFMHRVIMNAGPGQQIDHKNGDSLDNRRENLRFCNHSLNNANRTVRQASSGYRGVYKAGRRFAAKISVNNKRTWLGLFDVASDAARIYDAAALKAFGPFARLNFPEAA